MVSWDEIEGLFGRSHTLMLLESFCEKYAVPAEKKLDFSLMANVQEAFDHLSEVFEQDLRIGEVTATVDYCKDEYLSILKSAIWKIIGEEDTLAVKALMISEKEKERAASWS